MDYYSRILGNENMFIVLISAHYFFFSSDFGVINFY